MLCVVHAQSGRWRCWRRAAVGPMTDVVTTTPSAGTANAAVDLVSLISPASAVSARSAFAITATSTASSEYCGVCVCLSVCRRQRWTQCRINHVADVANATGLTPQGRLRK